MNPRTCMFNELWWSEFADGAPRDQLSLAFSLNTAARQVNFTTVVLTERKGDKVCGCAGDDTRFQRYFRCVGADCSKF